MRFFILLTIIIYQIILSDDISYIRYYANEKDFIANVPMKSTSRRGFDHLTAYFNDYNLPVKLEYYMSNGSLTKREIMEYNDDKVLVKKGEVNSEGKFLKLVVFSNDEPWSIEFQKSNFIKDEYINFTDQRSTFIIPRGEQVTQIIFETIDGKKYGKIELDYDYLNFLSEERWRSLPSGEIVRKFKYKFDLMSNVTQIWEYGKNNELISEVALDMVPADQLYRTPPPRTGNILDEYDIIKREIEDKRTLSSSNPIIPHTNFDQLVLKTGQSLDIDFVGTNQNGIQFRLNDNDGLLTVPFSNVRSLTSRMGDVIYPEAIEFRKSY
ncbi:MAG: hypothetical protein CBC40_07195 [bacterium TMED80]|nr:MAG: hypothetical protein CBC40_07195 [bacterium TMED80]